MAIIAKRQAAIPPGEHRGIITEAIETETDFGKGRKEPTVRITIQPAWSLNDKTETVPVSVSFSPVLNRISGLSKLLDRLNVDHPEDGAEFNPHVLEGVEVQFSADQNTRGFVQIEKDSIRRATVVRGKK